MEWFECRDIENTIISKPIIDHDLFLDLSIQFVDKPDELESKLNKYFDATIPSKAKWLFDKIKSVIIYRSNELRVPEPSELFKKIFDDLPEKIIGDDRFDVATHLITGLTKFDKDNDTSEILKFYLNFLTILM